MRLRQKLESWGFRSLPIFNPNDYKRRLVDLEEDFNYYIDEILRQAQEGKRHGKNWKKEWGFGKSTFLYNVSDFLNHNYLFHSLGDKSAYSHIFSIFIPFPEKLNNVIKRLATGEQDYIASLPGNPPISFHEVMRTVAFSILIEANKDNSSIKQTTTENIEELLQEKPKLRNEILENMKKHLEDRLPWSKTINEDLAVGLVEMTYPIGTAVFEEGFKKVRKRLNFDVFSYLLKLAKIFLVIIVDQVEYATASQLKELIQLVTDEENYAHIHLATVMRTDWRAWVKPSQQKDYQTLTERLEEERLSPLSEEGAKQLIISLLDEFRSSESTIPDRFYPFTEDAIEYLIKKSRDPAVHNEINPRRLLQLVTRVLSLAYRKCHSTISKKLLQTEEYDSQIEQTIGPIEAMEEEFEETETLG